MPISVFSSDHSSHDRTKEDQEQRVHYCHANQAEKELANPCKDSCCPLSQRSRDHGSCSLWQFEMVARFDVFLHHRYAAAIVPMIVCRRGAATTGPAELVAAEATGHVVASHVLLDAALAARAEADSVSVFLEPRAELLCHCFFTANIFSVPRFLTLEANLSAALRTRQLLCIFVWSAHVRLASRFGAPAHQRVSL